MGRDGRKGVSPYSRGKGYGGKDYGKGGDYGGKGGRRERSPRRDR